MSEREDSGSIVLSVDHISKNFFLPHEKTNSIKSGVVGIFKKKNESGDVQHALKDISFGIEKGEFFGILGRNGSGKSTLLKILAEIYKPTSGTVKKRGKLVPFIELGVGFNPELTGRENVYLNGALLGFSRQEIDERYDDIVAFAELEEFMDQKLKNYSSGMQVRLAFSVATRAEADILLIDEVLAVGDADFQRKCYDYFKSLKRSGKTVVFVTHDMGAVREYCDRAILINDGLITHEGSASEIATEYMKLFNVGSGDQSTQEPDRWGNEEIQFEGVKHTLNKDALTITADIVNRTDKSFKDSVDIGVDFYVDGKIVTGTHYLYYHKRGFSVKPGGRHALSVTFPNVFANHVYSVNMNIKTDGGLSVCDEWSNVFSFTTPYQEDTFFTVITHPESFEITEVKHG